jgi:ABC-type antimicrobial peptide transport system permease subunit
LPLLNLRTQEDQIDATLSKERVFATLSSGFGVLALILASIGIYGVMTYSVARRTSEIGIRMALGAQAREVLSMILREGFSMACIGVVAGVAVALALTRFVGGMLYGLKPTDPWTLAGSASLLLALAVLAGWLPARRASRVDPMIALRHE